MLKEFDDKKHLYEKLTKSGYGLLEQLAADENVEVAVLEGRVKNRDSLEQKIARPDKAGKYSKLDDITDLCGLRIVLFTDKDCALMTSAIRKNFDIDEANSVVKGADYAEDKFGYLSTHLVASLPQARTKLFEYRDLATLKMEIQIRTVLQHAWAVLDWKLRYKSNTEVPKEVRRRLYRVSALLEAADDTFSDLLDSVETLRAEYTRDIRKGKLEIPLNRDSLEAFLSESALVKTVLDKCRREAIPIHQSKTASDQAYDYLIRSLAACGITNLEQFEEKLQTINDSDVDNLKAISNSVPRVRFGVFTPLRVLMISKLTPEERRKVVTEMPTSGSAGKAEQEHFAPST